ncbi:hypothetical protein J6590_010444 [Homalodisca vitripennis]|nr:hypothetical protein J6590_010444 [Homalodisca vitripennis]
MTNLNNKFLSTLLICEVTDASIKIYEGKQLIVIGVYRPPNNCINITDEAIKVFHKVLESLPTYCRIIVLGDVNIDNLIPTRETIFFCELLSSYNMVRLQLTEYLEITDLLLRLFVKYKLQTIV